MPNVQELSVRLLGICFQNPERLKFWAPYLRNIPSKSELYSKYLFKRKHVPLLQDEQMVRCGLFSENSGSPEKGNMHRSNLIMNSWRSGIGSRVARVMG